MPQRHDCHDRLGKPSRPRKQNVCSFLFYSDFLVFLYLISPESHLESNLDTAGTPRAQGARALQGRWEEETRGGAAGRGRWPMAAGEGLVQVPDSFASPSSDPGFSRNGVETPRLPGVTLAGSLEDTPSQGLIGTSSWEAWRVLSSL